MTVTLDLSPELKRRTVAPATAQRLSVEAYLSAVIDAAAVPATSERASLEEFEAAMDALAEGVDDVPALAPEARTREGIDEHRG